MRLNFPFPIESHTVSHGPEGPASLFQRGLRIYSKDSNNSHTEASSLASPAGARFPLIYYDYDYYYHHHHHHYSHHILLLLLLLWLSLKF